MGQQDVLQYLQEQRKQNDSWFRVCEIKEALESKGFSNGAIKAIGKQVRQLVLYDIIEFKGVGIWNHYKVVRAKKEKKR